MIRLSNSLKAPRGVPDFWDPYKLRYGWPQYQRFYEHSREIGQKRMFYKDRTFKVASYDCGPRYQDVLLLQDLEGLGTLGEICTISTLKARKLMQCFSQKDIHILIKIFKFFKKFPMQRNLATFATPENITFYSHKFKSQLKDSGISEVSILTRRFNLFLQKITNAEPTKIFLPKSVNITAKNFLRHLNNLGIGLISTDNIVCLSIDGFEHSSLDFLSDELLETKESAKVFLHFQINDEITEKIEIKFAEKS